MATVGDVKVPIGVSGLVDLIGRGGAAHGKDGRLGFRIAGAGAGAGAGAIRRGIIKSMDILGGGRGLHPLAPPLRQNLDF